MFVLETLFNSMPPDYLRCCYVESYLLRKTVKCYNIHEKYRSLLSHPEKGITGVIIKYCESDRWIVSFPSILNMPDIEVRSSQILVIEDPSSVPDNCKLAKEAGERAWTTRFGQIKGNKIQFRNLMAPMHRILWQEYALPNGVIVSNLDLHVPRYVYDVNFSSSSGTWSPKPDGDGKYRYWGVDPVRNPKRDRFSWDRVTLQSYRTFTCRDLYPPPKVCPELQLCRLLADRKSAKLKSTKADRKHIYKKMFLLRIQLDDVTPVVYRDVYVSAGTALRTFADKILHPTMGWDRSYHR